MNVLRQTPFDYEKAKVLAREGDTGARRQLAAREDVRPEILYYLAEDRDADVRTAIAANQKTPRHADVLLARDLDDDVRCRLARKISRLVPNLPEAAKDKMREHTLEVLKILVEDRLPRVRQMLAEELQATNHAPPEVIRKLAQDADAGVAVPVLEFSPLLTDADLLAIIATDPAEAAMTAIARRDGVHAPVSDAIVATENVPAIAALLANPVAQIREETLDRIVTQAPSTPSWHEPLARRATLPPRILQKLTGFLAGSLLQSLQNRGDLDPETAHAVAAALEERLRREAGKPAEGDARALAVRDVQNLLEEGRLDEKAIATAVGEGKHFFVTEALAALARTPVKMVERILGTGNAAAVAALSWKASLGARLASRIQTRIAHISPTEALSTETDAYPMDEAAMRLQLDSFAPASETEALSDAEETARPRGPVDPDWSRDDGAKGKAAVDPDWAAGKAADTKPLAEPDWAQDETPEPAEETDDAMEAAATEKTGPDV